MNISENKMKHYLDRVAEIIRTDATNIDRVNFLATHTPFKKLIHVTSGITEVGKSEMDEETFFLKHVLERRNDHQFIIVQGDNGTGKSHFIRWVKERYENAVNPTEEAVLFISRSQSTLRGALEQIINSGIFEENDTVDHIKKLILANEHLSESNLKQNIIHQFAIAVQNDEETSLLPSKIKKNLYFFLVDPAIQEFLFKESGPIERIKLRLAAESSNQRLDDISPRFEVDDFAMTVDLLTAFKQSDVSRRALKLAESLFNDDNSVQLRKDLADYLNQFLESVVQRCVNLRGSDLKDVFQHLRKELKGSGKNLTLFIEDITSFTGIDRALVEVLVTEHKGTDYNEEYCRLLSFVGITNEYYKTTIPDNLKERVTGRVLIDKASLFSGNQISEMAARYLNAIYLERNELVKWVEEGAQEETLPIAPIYAEHEWATFRLQNNRTFTLFPFNQIALKKFYDALDYKTPRRFLKHVLTHLLQLYFVNEEFPPKITDLSTEFANLPNFIDSLSKRTIDIKAPDFSEQLTSFLRLWGDGTVDTKEEDGQFTVGGLPESAFKAFGLPFIVDKNRVGRSKPDAKPDPNPDINPNPRLDPEPVPSPPRNPGQDAFGKVEEELDKWLNNNGKLTSYNSFREDIYSTFIEFIDWEAEGVSAPLVSDNFMSRRIHIEGQSVTTRGSDYFTIEKSSSTYYALLAMAAWRHLGNKSWSFEGSINYLPGFYNWLQEQKKKVISFVKYPREINNPDQWQFCKWNILTSYYLMALSGNINRGDTSALKIYEALLQSPNIRVEENRSTNWITMQKRFKQPVNSKLIQTNYELFRGMHNRVQGKITDKTEVHFIDAAAILKEIDQLKKSEWDIENVVLPDRSIYKESSRYVSLLLLDLIKQLLPLALNDESSLVRERVNQVLEYVGSEEAATDLFNEMRELLTYFRTINEGYSTDDFKGLQNRQLNQQQLISHISALKQVGELKGDKLLLGLVNCPIERLAEYIRLFEKINNLLSKKNTKFDEKQRSLEQRLKDGQTEQIIESTREQIENLRSRIEGIHQEASHVIR
ncbi:hypothetical protein [Bacillus sp. 165]|uniref:hypothetical protein n=1 Tax=Bacillus sp. 165 TaxID=1529117 RepID=UPI001AD9621A|nr:hypothetical protein [Bacillus sp. 165]MBO9128580.1 hypothetical protein [Bacillus sp. 165]